MLTWRALSLELNLFFFFLDISFAEIWFFCDLEFMLAVREWRSLRSDTFFFSIGSGLVKG